MSEVNMKMLRAALAELALIQIRKLQPGASMHVINYQYPVAVGMNLDGTYGVHDGPETYGPFKCGYFGGDAVKEAVDHLVAHIVKEGA